MRRCDRVEVTCKVQVHFFHWNDLRVTTACGTTLHTKTWAKRSFADTNGGFFADRVQAIAQTNSRGCFTFTGRCRVDRSNQNQFAVFFASLRRNEFSRDFGFVVTKWKQVSRGDA